MLKMVYMGNGIGVVYTDRTRPVSMRITVGQGFFYGRASSIAESDTNDVYNAFLLRYRYNVISDKYEGLVTRDNVNSSLCRLSQHRLGRREINIDSVTIIDENTANTVIDWLVNHVSLPSYVVTYKASPKTLFYVTIGDNIELTDNFFGIEQKIGTVESVSYVAGEVEVRVRLWLQY